MKKVFAFAILFILISSMFSIHTRADLFSVSKKSERSEVSKVPTQIAQLNVVESLACSNEFIKEPELTQFESCGVAQKFENSYIVSTEETSVATYEGIESPSPSPTASACSGNSSVVSSQGSSEVQATPITPSSQISELSELIPDLAASPTSATAPSSFKNENVTDFHKYDSSLTTTYYDGSSGPTPLSPGSLRVYVKNVDGSYIAGVRVVLYDSNWNVKGEQTTNSLGYVYWSSLSDATYFIEAYYPSTAALGYEEFWGGDEVYVSGATTFYFTRHTQWAYDVKINGQSLPGSTVEIDPGQKIDVDITVKNSEIVSKNVKVKVILDRSRSSPYDYNQDRGPVNIGSNGYGSFSWDYYPSSSGSYYIYVVVYGYYNGRYIVTDQWDWTYAFSVREPPGKLYVKVGNYDDDSQRVSIYVDGSYWGYMDVASGYVSTSVDKEVEPGNHVVRIEWHDDDTNQNYQKSLTKYVGSGQRVEYYFSLDKHLTPLSIYVRDQNNNPEGSATVVRYDSNWNYKDEKLTDSNGLAYWPSIEDGTFNFEVYNLYDELWGDFSLSVGNKGSITYYFTRFMPYAYEITASKTSISVGESITITVYVRNPSSLSRSVRVKILLDRSKSSPWDWESPYQQKTISSGGATTFAFTWTADEAGTYYVWTNVETYLTGPAKWVLTDHWVWYPSFTVQMPGHLRVKLTSYDDDYHAVDVYVDEEYWGFVDSHAGQTTYSVWKAVEPNKNHAVKITWYDDDTGKNYEKTSTKYVGSDQYVEYPFTIDLHTGWISISGHVYYMDDQSNQKPVDGALVELYDEDWEFDDLLGSTHTTPEGSFVFSQIKNEDNELGESGTLDLYFKVKAMNLAVKVVDSTEGTHEFKTVTFSDVPDGEDDWDIYSPAELNGAFNILSAITKGNRYIDLFDDTPPQVKVKWYVGHDPVTSDGRHLSFYRRSEDKIYLSGTTADPDEFDDCVILHEYGHFIMDKFWGDNEWPPYPASGTETDASRWREGWAQFFQSAARANYPEYYPDPHLYFDKPDLVGDDALNLETWIWGNEYMWVASILWDIYDAPPDDQEPDDWCDGDILHLGFNEIWDVFTNYDPDPSNASHNHPWTIHEFWDGWFARGHGHSYEMWSVFFEHSVNKDFARPDGPGSHTSSHTIETWSSDTTIYVRWSGATDALSGVYGYEIIWDNSPTTIPEEYYWWDKDPHTVDFNISHPLSDGTSWYLHVRAVDRAGNWAADAYHVGPFYIDTSPPNAPSLVETHCGSDWTTHNSPYITWSDPGDSGSGVSYFEVSINDGTPFSVSSPYDPTCSDGIYTFRVRAIDGVGISSDWSNQITVKIDTTAPSTPSPDDGVSGWSSDSTPTFTWLPSSDSGSEVAGYFWRVDSGPETWIISTSVTVPPQSDGGHTFWVRAVDNADNPGSWGSHSFQIDTNPPSSSIAHSPGSASVYVEATDPTPGSGVHVIYVRVDVGSWTEYLGAGPVEIILTGTGSHTIEAYSIDNSQPPNSETPPQSLILHYLTVNTDPPGLDNPSGEGWYDEGTDASISVAEVSGYTFEYWYLDGSPGTQYSLDMETTVTMDAPHIATAKFTSIALGKVYVDPAIGTANPGGTFIINITVANVTGLNAWEIKLRWDLSVLKFPPTIIEGSFLSDVGNTQMYVYESMIYKFIQIGVALSEPKTASGNGTLATIEFQVPNGGNCTLDLYDTKLFDIDLNAIMHTTEDAYFYTPKPFAFFTWTPAAPLPDQTVTFNASASYDPDGGNIISYSWDFGDGTPAGTGMIVTHTYTAYRRDPYIVNLTVTDDEDDRWFYTEELRIRRDVAIVDIWVTDQNLEYAFTEVVAGEEIEYPPYAIVVTAVNYGTQTETFNVTLTFSTPTDLIGYGVTNSTYTVTLAPWSGSGLSLWYDWEPTDPEGNLLPAGTYTFTASATSLEGEDETDNNILSMAVTITPAHACAYLVVRGMNDRIYYRSYDGSWEDWLCLPGGTCDQPASAVLDDCLHIVVRGATYTNSLWHGYVNLTDDSFSGWTRVAGATSSAPTLISDGSSLYLVVRGMNDRIYYNVWDGSWSGFTVISGATSDSPASAIVNGEVHIVVRGATQVNSLWHGQLDVSTNVCDWAGISGATPSAPTLTS